MSKEHEPVTIGWCEYVDFPEWGIKGLRAKADTGARSSSLHVENLQYVGRSRIAFDVVTGRKAHSKRVRVKARITRYKRVRSSNGESSVRPFVTVPVKIGPVTKEIELNLVDRGAMIHRMLIGRTGLSGLLVDVDRRYVLGKRKPATKAANARAVTKRIKR